MNRKVILGMSGGVDSCVAAHLLKEKGYDVLGVTFKVWPKSLCGTHDSKNCCSVDAITDARTTCAKLNIPHYVIDCQKEFKKLVIDDFLSSYVEGKTPNPCIICNERIKFPLLLKKARETKSAFIATGHHARSVYSKASKQFFIREGKDKNKDQSYVLFGLNQNILSKLLLPVGDYTKPNIRSIAEKLGLKVSQKRESQEICFVVDDDLGRFLKENLKPAIKPGLIKDKSGKVLGEHAGTCFFTIGQRKGLRIPYGKPIYVTSINHSNGDIIVGEHKETLKSSLTAEKVTWIKDSSNKSQIIADVKIRYKDSKTKATIKRLSSRRCQVDFKIPVSSPTPGQAVVFYQRGSVIGGGWIMAALA
ncbi:tRNA 2-thiouridine(34) synthase MnmA [Candidatus Omnitrophota bacterium]